jgi:hypothetical protein
MVKEWDRKEVRRDSVSNLLIGGVDIWLYGQGKDQGKQAHGWGRNESEAREAAYKEWDEKYR